MGIERKPCGESIFPQPAKDVVVAAGYGTEDAAEFEALQQKLWDKYDPRDIQDELDVEELATAYWRKRRVLRAEMGSIRLSLDTIPADRIRKPKTNFDLEALLVSLDGNKEYILSAPGGLDQVLTIADELEAEMQNKRRIPLISSRFDVLQPFGIRLGEV